MSPAAVDRIRSWALSGGAVVLLGWAWVGDLLNLVGARQIPAAVWGGPPRSDFNVLPVVSGAVVVAVVVGLVSLRPGRTATAAGAVVAAAVPIAASAMLAPLPTGEYFGYPFTTAELAGLLLVLAVVAFRCAPLPIVGVAAVAVSALLSDALRNIDIPESSEGLLSTAVLAVVLGLAPGLYLRWRDDQRRSQVARARQEERLSVARDLHDEVAHKLTGIVVQAQALRYIADGTPERAQAVLPEIERSAGQALASMRRLVATLRVAEDAPVTDGRGVTEALRGLEQAPGAGLPRVDVTVSGPVDDLPADVGAAVVRISQEAVTNALRHARDATDVTVNVAVGAGQANLEVRDNGQGSASSFTGGGGHGVVGMAERARLLGGEASAGPARSGPGWRVRAELPVSGLPTSEKA